MKNKTITILKPYNYKKLHKIQTEFIHYKFLVYILKDLYSRTEVMINENLY